MSNWRFLRGAQRGVAELMITFAQRLFFSSPPSPPPLPPLHPHHNDRCQPGSASAGRGTTQRSPHLQGSYAVSSVHLQHHRPPPPPSKKKVMRTKRGRFTFFACVETSCGKWNQRTPFGLQPWACSRWRESKSRKKSPPTRFYHDIYHDIRSNCDKISIEITHIFTTPPAQTLKKNK